MKLLCVASVLCLLIVASFALPPKPSFPTGGLEVKDFLIFPLPEFPGARKVCQTRCHPTEPICLIVNIGNLTGTEQSSLMQYEMVRQPGNTFSPVVSMFYDLGLQGVGSFSEKTQNFPNHPDEFAWLWIGIDDTARTGVTQYTGVVKGNYLTKEVTLLANLGDVGSLTPASLAIDRDDNIYVTDTANGKIYHTTYDGAAPRVWYSDSALTPPDYAPNTGTNGAFYDARTHSVVFHHLLKGLSKRIPIRADGSAGVSELIYDEPSKNGSVELEPTANFKHGFSAPIFIPNLIYRVDYDVVDATTGQALISALAVDGIQNLAQVFPLENFPDPNLRCCLMATSLWEPNTASPNYGNGVMKTICPVDRSECLY